MRDEHYFPDLFNRDAYPVRIKKGALSIEQKARLRLREILDKYYPPEPVIDRRAEKELDAILRSAMKEGG